MHKLDSSLASPIRTTRTFPVIPALVIVLLLWIAVVVTLAQLRMAPTFDEQNHVTRGISILRTGDYRLALHHPPLANILEALPVAWRRDTAFSTAMPSWSSDDPGVNLNIWRASKSTLWEQSNSGLTLIHLARLPVLLFSLLLAVVIFLWSRALFGPWGGVLSLAFYALDPNILSHSGLATTDMAATCMIALALYWFRGYLIQPHRLRLLLAGAGIGLALASKFNALILVPIIGLLLLLAAVWPTTLGFTLPISWSTKRPGWRLSRAFGVFMLLGCIAGVLIWATYGFQIEPLGKKPGKPLPTTASTFERLPVPALQYLRGIRIVTMQAEDHRAYLLGMTDTTGSGWWYYFPVAIATKSPIPMLLAVLCSLMLFALPRVRAKLTFPRGEWLLLLLPVAIYLLAAMGFLGIKLNLGIRHILPIYPFIFIGLGILATIRPSTGLYAWALGGVLLLQGVAVGRNYPDFLAYFNELSGGRQNGYKILVDSNYDWGQDLGRLAELQHKEQLYPLAFSYFGTTPPEAYGVTYTPLPGFGLMRTVPMPDLADYQGYIAISATNLYGGIGYTGQDYPRLLKEKNARLYGRAGNTIFIYSTK
jgi:4-amino-4-deoxy-L-arabinose transferase-like glycosyltransferase